jgi:signal transduction histidine kinase/ActR/RegA family two-component response regulator
MAATASVRGACRRVIGRPSPVPPANSAHRVQDASVVIAYGYFKTAVSYHLGSAQEIGMRQQTAERAAMPGALGRLRQWWLDRSTRAKGMTVVSITLIALVGTTSASLVLQRIERQERAAALADFALVNGASQVLADAVNAETGARGYAATGRALFLAPYQEGLSRIGADRALFHQAASALHDVPRQRAADATAAQALSELAQIRAAVGRGASTSSLQASLASEKATMDRLRAQVTQLTKAPAAQLASNRSRVTGLESATGTLDIAGLALGLLAGLVGVGLFTSGISARVVAAAANADRLGEGLPLVHVASARDDLGRLEDSLARAEDLLASRAAQLTIARDEALQATQAKNAFLSSTSHELRTPLNSILGFTQLLEMSSLNAEDQDGVQRILGAGRHLLALINELIDIARIESGDLSLSLEPVAVMPLVEQVSKLLAPLAAERSVRVIADCRSPDLAVLADRQRCSQILVNLVSNAVKYNRSGGTITISCRETAAGQARVVVADTGRGMSAEDLERIFVPFERLGADSSVEGTGIGLPLAQALAGAMGGELTASSVVGVGSEFAVTLPRAQLPQEAPVSGPRPASPAKRRARAKTALRILYIEDNPANVEVVARYLRTRPGAQLRAFTSGRVGLQSARQDRADLILLDLHLQDTHGEDVLTDLKAEPATAGIPVVILSADATVGTIRRLLARGALAYLTKPLDLTELGELLDSIEVPAQHAAGPAKAAP